MKNKKIKNILAWSIFSFSLLGFSKSSAIVDRYKVYEGENITIQNESNLNKYEAEIEGNSMVNLLGSRGKERVLLTWGSREKNYPGITLKNNTTYTFICNTYQNADHPTYLIDGLRVYYTYRDKSNVQQTYYTELVPASAGKGYVVGTFTTRDSSWGVPDGEYFTPYVLMEVSQEGYNYEYDNAILLEGDYSEETIEYFEYMKSVGETSSSGMDIDLVLNNKNLYPYKLFEDVRVSKGNLSLIDNGFKITATGNDSYMDISVDIPLAVGHEKYCLRAKENTTYNLSFNTHMLGDSTYDVYISFRDANKKLIKCISLMANQTESSMSKNFTTPKGTKYIIVRFDNNIAGTTIEYTNIMLEENNKKTDYVKYNSQIRNITSADSLRGLPNGISDKIVYKNGKWYIERNLKEVVFNGSEPWQAKTGNWETGVNTTGFYLRLSDMKDTAHREGDNIVSNNFPCKPAIEMFDQFDGNNNFDMESIGKDYKDLAVRISKRKVAPGDINGFKNYLHSNPLRVVYQLANPYYEELNIKSGLDINLESSNMYIKDSILNNLKVTIDRVNAIADNAVDSVIDNPTENSMSNARELVNALEESWIKDFLQEKLNGVTPDIGKVERKQYTANTDIYIKPENVLSVSLNTNYITFEDFTGTEDLEKKKELEINVDSSLPYEVNTYLQNGIYNKDKTITVNPSVLNIKLSDDITYKNFTGVNNPIKIIDGATEKNKSYMFDFKLSGGIITKADIYKTTLKFEVKQK